MLLAEANQWPEDAAAYFGHNGKGGSGDSCDMAFHFPLMTRLYMAVETEDRFPVVDILEQTPAIPPNCQWAIFLRNHDELTLEMVTDEERDYMYRVFAKDRRARINLGIRRRLAPLLGNNRRKIELMNCLLLSLPGTPVIYYGDEIGMGDNIYLGDRDGVRTPMQWSADRNAGFSSAPAQRLYLPVIADSEHHYAAVNVEAQEANPSSLLWWMRRRIRLRQSHPVFGRGVIRFLEPENGRVLAFVREGEGESVLVLANLSQHPQAARLDLGDFRGSEPLELAGGAHFPVITTDPWPIMLGAHDCLWLLLRKRSEELSSGVRRVPDAGECADLSAWLAGLGPVPALMESHAVQAPWFAGKNRPLSRVVLRDVVAAEVPDCALLMLRADFLQGDPEEYCLWLGFVPEDGAEALPAPALVARIRLGGTTGYLCEAQHLPAFRMH
jgi:maltose alpha-D-glucosyltransferase/alpha-amylase